MGGGGETKYVIIYSLITCIIQVAWILHRNLIFRLYVSHSPTLKCMFNLTYISMFANLSSVDVYYILLHIILKARLCTDN